MTEVTARIGKGDKASPPVKIDYDFGKNIDEAVKKFGEDVVFSHFHSSAVIALQSRMRAAMKEDVEAGRAPNASKVGKALEGWKLGKKEPGKSKAEKADQALAGLDPETRAEILKKYAAQAKAA